MSNVDLSWIMSATEEELVVYMRELRRRFKSGDSHTPGPWVVREVERGKGTWRFIYQKEPRSMFPIARVFGDPRPAAVNQANAALVAAAPELLRVLREWFDAEYGYGAPPSYEEVLEVLRSAEAA